MTDEIVITRGVCLDVSSPWPQEEGITWCVSSEDRHSIYCPLSESGASALLLMQQEGTLPDFAERLARDVAGRRSKSRRARLHR